ncbi:hypothetical protein SAMN02745216_01431 [Desulfatibacillum alkenivorans DSM 16219]|jgi:hypothetical protein|uniref:Uncharacterized protein n=1 Tax=Desulfatibacillum alkenivorans DSM 16219 TaxID=1121393 RepID=A0A1M6ICT5_9BACT|nr:hypothetical protein [Desulfatibacillum alkenivorans]SHJ32203.1 hypothetical protein SAMN02745216_01431 [Desulfatibacillum alkenivorans DSM 16219]
MKTKRLVLLFISAILLLVLGCDLEKKELEAVAKDWCMTIRASQVMPIYPLSEDVQPGDVFLVKTPISEQVKQWGEKGYIPLDLSIARLQGLNYEEYYKDAYWKGDYAEVPHDRPRPKEDEAQKEGNDKGVKAKKGAGAQAAPKQVEAPRAAFPGYSFRVKQGQSMALALPIEGIPFSLSLMNASDVQGSVWLLDARTYGMDANELLTKLNIWWSVNADKSLKGIADQMDQPVYLRVVTRVFYAHQLKVELSRTKGFGAGVEGGKETPDNTIFELAMADPNSLTKTSFDATKTNYDKLLKTLSDQLGGGLIPGGSAKFVQASQRSVGMVQSFQEPLVIGYLGFDVKIFENGKLSAPIPTYTLLSEGALNDASFAKPLDWIEDEYSAPYFQWLKIEGNYLKMSNWLKKKGYDVTPGGLYNTGNERILKKADEEFHFMELSKSLK